RAWLVALWLVAVLFSASALLTDAWVQGVRRYAWGYYPVYGWASVPFVVFFFALFTLALLEFRRDHAHATVEEDRQRSLAFLRAFGVGAVGALAFLPPFGVPLYPLGSLAVLAFLGIAAGTIRRYRLPDPLMVGEEKFRAVAESASDAIVSFNSRG